MDEIGSVMLAMFVIFLVVILVMVGLVALIAIGVLVGMGYLVYKIAVATLAEMEQARQQQERQRLAVLEEQRLAAQKALEAAQEEARRQQLQLRQEQEGAARQILEARWDETNAVLTADRGGLLVRCPSAEQIRGIIEQGATMLSRRGRYLHVLAVVGAGGVSLEWKAYTGSQRMPVIIGLRGGDQMFVEHAFAGKHTARLQPGRHTLSFRVLTGYEPVSEDHDLSFEIFVQAPEAVRAGSNFKKSVNTAVTRFVNRAQTVGDAKRKVEQALRTQGCEDQEVIVEMSKLEAEIHDLQQDET